MSIFRQRNLQLLRMRREGVSVRELARVFGVSTSRVNMILRRLEEVRQLAERKAALLHDLRQADDLDARWPAPGLVNALGLLPITASALRTHFQWESITTVSLRELMDLAIPEAADPTTGTLKPPLLSLRCVGKEGFWSVVNRLVALDLGSHCDQEWERRLHRLRSAWGIKGAFPYSRPKTTGSLPEPPDGFNPPFDPGRN